MRSRSLRDFFDFIKINGRLFIGMGSAIVAMAALQFHTSEVKKECMGVVDLKETNISFDTSVIVKRIFVLPGQKVKKGQALLEVKPVETALKILELKTQLNQLVSEKEIIDSLFTNKTKGSPPNSPVELQIEGLKSQIAEVEGSLKQAVRFAETDGVVGSVNFRASEQVAPFLPVITLNSTEPNLVYGFVHEDRISDFQMGESVIIQSLNRNSKRSLGSVISLGNRITEFPERLTANPLMKFWGREIVVSLPAKNIFLPGEKVQIISKESEGHGFLRLVQALAGAPEISSPKIAAYNLPFEPSGITFLPGSNELQLITVSDDLNPANGSPFWAIDTEKAANHNYLAIDTPIPFDPKDDLESLSASGDSFFAMGSLKSKNKGGRLFQFHTRGNKISIDRVIPIREKLVASLTKLPALKSVTKEIRNNLEIEGFSVNDDRAVFALKEPLLKDGSTLLLEVTNFLEFLESNGKKSLEVSVLSPLFLESESCSSGSWVSDLTWHNSHLLILTNCRAESVSQLWRFKMNHGLSYPSLLQTFEIPNLEGVAINKSGTEVYLSDDNGNDGLSTVFKSPISLAP